MDQVANRETGAKGTIIKEADVYGKIYLTIRWEDGSLSTIEECRLFHECYYL